MVPEDGSSDGTPIAADIPGPEGHKGTPHLPIGTMLDRGFAIRSVLGRGGFGLTYVAEHTGLGRRVALKEHFPEQFAIRDGLNVRATAAGGGMFKWGLDRFLDEARRLGRLKHPSIVDVTDVFEANGTAYMALAYEEGETLAAWLARLQRAPTQDELDRLMEPLLDALEHLHGHDLLHRDIAPDNIILRRDGTPVLIDFGAARHAQAEKSHVLTGIVKHGYSPPEQYSLSATRHGPWSDIYALAATLYRAISGKRLPDSPTRQLDDQARDLTDFVDKGYRRDFLVAINRALTLQPAMRPQSVKEWRAKLYAPIPPAPVQPPKPSANVRPPQIPPPDVSLPKPPLPDAETQPASQRGSATAAPALLILASALLGFSFEEVLSVPARGLLAINGVLAVSGVVLFLRERYARPIAILAITIGAIGNTRLFLLWRHLVDEGAISKTVGYLPLINLALLLMALAIIILKWGPRRTA